MWCASYLVSVIELVLSIVHEGKWTFVVGNTLFTLFGLIMVPAMFSKLPRSLRRSSQSQGKSSPLQDKDYMSPLVSPKEKDIDVQGWATGGLKRDPGLPQGMMALFVTYFSVAGGLFIVWVSYLGKFVHWGGLVLLSLPQVV